MLTKLALGCCFIIFFICVLGIVLEAPFRIYLYLQRNRRVERPHHDEAAQPRKKPYFHLIQLPVFNEDFSLVAQLLQSAVTLEYPKDRMMVQLLDDSDDPLLSKKIKTLVEDLSMAAPDLQLCYLHRTERKDFKAGNLNHGLITAQSVLEKKGIVGSARSHEVLISIFDADFVVPTDYLDKVEQWFSETGVGVVQTGIDFYNRHASHYHQAIAVFQDNLHKRDFSVRSACGHLSTFRGSAGTIRMQMLAAYGFWAGDTQIEDVDLSFCAQADGWRVVYDSSICCSSSLPSGANEYKLQQRSWVKGLMEVMKKNLHPLITSKHLGMSQKLFGVEFFALFALQPLFMVISHLLIIPTCLFWHILGQPFSLDVTALLIFGLLWVSHIPFLSVSARDIGVEGSERALDGITQMIRSFFIMVGLFSALTFGLIEGLAGRRVHRDRTIKRNGEKDDTAYPEVSTKGSQLLKTIWYFELLVAGNSLVTPFFLLSLDHTSTALIYLIPAVIYPVQAFWSYSLLRKG